jgi:hypothetical protein
MAESGTPHDAFVDELHTYEAEPKVNAVRVNLPAEG